MTTRSRTMAIAMLCSAAVTAQFVSGKATRDALFLTSLDFTALPAMMMATSVCSILLVAAYARLATRVAPSRLVPASFVVSGALFLGEWLARSTAPAATAVVVYLHVSGVGPLLASGVWLNASEQFDPRSARRGFGRIIAAGTLGGLVGALVAERVAALLGVPAMLLLLAVFQFVTAWLAVLLSGTRETYPGSIEAVPGVSSPLRSGLRVVADAPHLRHLALLVLLGTTAAALIEYLFKAQAVETFGPGDNLLRFFAVYYAATNLITFVLQTLSSRAVLERFGLALTTSTPSIALLAGSVGSLAAPGFGGLLVARASESIFRASWFRAGYELFYTPVAAAEKRAAKSVIDVGVDRLGDAVGGGLVRLAIVFLPAAQSPAILSLAIGTSVAAIVVASSLNRWYLRTLEKSLVHLGRGLDLSNTDADSIRPRQAGAIDTSQPTMAPDVEGTLKTMAIDPVMQDALALRSGSRRRVSEVLCRPEPLGPGLVSHAIPLLAWDAVADHALAALRQVADARIGELTDALLDQSQDYAVRRRLARVFSACATQRAVDGLVLALDDARFEVRFQCARSLAAILEKDSALHVDREHIYDVVVRAVTAASPVWESDRAMDGFVRESPLEEFVRDRASQSLAHVFTLLSLVLPRDPLRIAFRSLHSDDTRLRGTALEYLEGVLPGPIRERLWPFLGDATVQPRPARRQDDVIADLLRANPSITLKNIAERE
jgi:hypothetical protein